MPKNAQGEVKCINEGTSINSGSNVHQMLRIEGHATMLQAGKDQQNRTIVNPNKILGFEVYVCPNCHYSEMYKVNLDLI